ncbi:HSP20-like chaperone [Lentinula aciculospora]|uniref:HSP20-like chaperone n=1 Tax=Lentinula aciculospora TaxID=153920 RepID=A0A9W9DVR1_9AGAR|nr:HSP20-like chaperone [Lentinula aciculospora]
MPRCTRLGCGKDFSESSTESCTFHPGAPVFHEGLKSWSCCPDKNKPVLDFDEFMEIKGCVETDRHTNDMPDPKFSAPAGSASVKEVAKTPPKEHDALFNPVPPPTAVVKAIPAPPLLSPPVEEEDDLSVMITPGTRCRRKGCNVTFISDEENRVGNGEGSRCTYHPAPPIFREGSKGYMCCKRRVLEFEEFLKIEGCKTGRHLFSPKVNPDKTEELTTCRLDHYQTLDQVHVSVFAKQVDRDRSSVKFHEQSLSIDLYLPGSKRFLKTIDLFGPITPEQSTVQYFGTKVDVHLKKQDTRSWTILEKPTHDLGNIALTFGVTGRTGTIGAKQSVLDAQNNARI